MKYHILNGDALAEKISISGIEGQLVIIREAFIEGPLSTEFTPSFWKERAAFVRRTYEASEEEYEAQFGRQLKHMDEIQRGDEVYLWFEDDLFCQANMWFAIRYISSRVAVTFYRIFPGEDKIHWSGFGRADIDDLIGFLKECILLTENDIALSNRIWEAFVENDTAALTSLSLIVSKGFRFLPEVISAHLERTGEPGIYGRPKQTLVDILQQGKTNFYEICDAFWEKNSIYGFGDLQVLNMLKELEIEFSED